MPNDEEMRIAEEIVDSVRSWTIGEVNAKTLENRMAEALSTYGKKRYEEGLRKGAEIADARFDFNQIPEHECPAYADAVWKIREAIQSEIEKNNE